MALEGNYPDVEFSVMDNGNPMEVDTELITITVGNINRAPEFDPIGAQTVDENVLLEFQVLATDPDGDALTYYTGFLPPGASFDDSTRIFSWRPEQGQEGHYVVIFYAQDSGTPSLTGQLDVAITVNNVLTPIELTEDLNSQVQQLGLSKEVENSYMANLKKVSRFITEGKITPAITQLNAFRHKVEADVAGGKVDATEGNQLIQMASSLVDKLQG